MQIVNIDCQKYLLFCCIQSNANELLLTTFTIYYYQTMKFNMLHISFARNKVLRQTDGIEDQGTILWDLALILLLAWIIVYLCLFKGVRWTGKVTILLPFTYTTYILEFCFGINAALSLMLSYGQLF